MNKPTEQGISPEEQHAMNNSLLDFARRWKLDGDYLRCLKCNAPHLAGYHDKPMIHNPGCVAAAKAETHPWQTLAALLRPVTARLSVIDGDAEEARAGRDADLIGVGFLVDGMRLDPKRVAVKLPRRPAGGAEFRKAALADDAVERAARAMAIRDGWDGWDTASHFNDTMNGCDPEDEREHYRELARAALCSFVGGAG